MTLGPGIHRTKLPLGFLAAGINCGVRKYRPDLGLLVSLTPSSAAAVYTTNTCKAAAIKYCQSLTPSPDIRAIVTNSGQANAVTGPRGVDDNLRMAAAVGRALGCRTDQVLTASTGVIGVRLEIEKIERGVPELLERTGDYAEPFAVAILTTDLVPKSVTSKIFLSQGEVTITGICKGSGMIHPNMATMLAYVITDAKVSPAFAQEILGQATESSFNRISVDGDMSTNDCVFMMANGAAGVPVVSPEDICVFRDTVTEICQILAKAIARDGEGATKLIEVTLDGAASLDLANRAARSLTLSPLVKAAIHGEDPNWGRIIARLGAEGVPGADLERMDLKLQGISLLEKGIPLPFDKLRMKEQLKKDIVEIKIDFGLGAFSSRAWGCDLSKKYVEINAEYSS
jgi:glutamate N-acetyltransferase/amino-acid N-acetyltransferase